MKYILGLFGLLALLFSFHSCSEDINLTGDFKESVIVHGLLDQADSVHFIKINRAFIGPGNSYEIAQEPDSNIFTNIVTTVTEVLNDIETRVWTLTDTLIDNKDPNGVFYSPTETLYYFHTIGQAPLNPSARYRLDININDGKLKVQGETHLVSGITSPTSSQNFTFKFADNPASYTSTGVTVSSAGNSYVVNSTLEVNFKEFIGSTGTTKSFKWNLGEADVVPYDSKTFTANGETFYKLIKSNVTNNPSITRRTFESITVVITGGAEDLYNYMTVNKPSSSLAQNKPTYTNLSIEGDGRVLGIFSSRSTMRYVKPFYVSAAQAYIRAIDKKSTRELCTGQITGLYSFCSDHPGDNVSGQVESYACQ